MKKSEKDFNQPPKDFVNVNFERILECMKFAGMTDQKEICEAAGLRKDKQGRILKNKKTGKPIKEITEATLCNWKYGKTKPTRKKIEIVADVLGVNPLYLTGESKNPAILASEPKIKNDIRDSKTGHLKPHAYPYKIGNNYYDLEGLMQEGIKRRNESASREYDTARSVFNMLGYQLMPYRINGDIDEKHFCLTIPEEKQQAIPNYDQFATMQYGLPITKIEYNYLISQLKSVLDLFEQTIINYYTSDMAFINMIDQAHLEAHQTQSFSDGLNQLLKEGREKNKSEKDK